jgi:hypothetical protein
MKRKNSLTEEQSYFFHTMFRRIENKNTKYETRELSLYAK